MDFSPAPSALCLRILKKCVFVAGPRLRQHHAHHQKPTVERHWRDAACWGKAGGENQPQLSAPVCWGRNTWNPILTQRTQPWPALPLVNSESIQSRLDTPGAGSSVQSNLLGLGLRRLAPPPPPPPHPNFRKSVQTKYHTGLSKIAAMSHRWAAGQAEKRCKTVVCSRGKKSRSPSIYFVLPIKEALRHKSITAKVTKVIGV